MKHVISAALLAFLLVGCGTTVRVIEQDDQVDIGYGTVNKKDLTAAVSNVKVDSREVQPYNDMYDYLRGRVPGVMVTNDRRIIIRGIGTNSGSTDPLILVDGVPVTNLSGLNPGDVESVDVIKDGSSAIYGVQGANGVIIIKTRR